MSAGALLWLLRQITGSVIGTPGSSTGAPNEQSDPNILLWCLAIVALIVALYAAHGLGKGIRSFLQRLVDVFGNFIIDCAEHATKRARKALGIPTKPSQDLNEEEEEDRACTDEIQLTSKVDPDPNRDEPKEPTPF
jgi:hypothetical protein